MSEIGLLSVAGHLRLSEHCGLYATISVMARDEVNLILFLRSAARFGGVALRCATVVLAALAFPPHALAQAVAPAPATPSTVAAATPSAGAAPTRRSPRVGPSELSTAEIREQAARRPYPLDFGQRLDRGHDWLYVNAQEFVENTDRRFAPPDAELLPVPATPLRLAVVTETINRPDGAKFELNLNLDVTLKLPNLERRLRIFITNDDVAESPDRAGERGNLRAGVRFNPASNFDFDIGVRGDLPPIAFASLRWTKFYPVGRWDIYPFGKLFAETEEGLGASTGLTFDRRLGETLIGRASSFAQWRKDTAEIEWTQILLLAHADELLVPERYGRILRNQDLARGYGLQLLATGERRNRVEFYEASVFYRRPLRHRWLYLYVEPLVRWDRRYAWNADPGIRIGLEALLWDLSRSRSDTPGEPILLNPTEDRPVVPRPETAPGIAPGQTR